MKKAVALLLAAAMCLCLAACDKKVASTSDNTSVSSVDTTTSTDDTAVSTDDTTTSTDDTAVSTDDSTPVVDLSAKSEGVMTYAEFDAAELETEVVIETYVQAHQSWYKDAIKVYSCDPDGAYYLYNMVCSEEDAAKLVPGTKIRVTGFKAAWSGEVELAEGCTFEFVDDGTSYIAEAEDISAMAGEDLTAKMNQFVAFTGATVEDCGDGKAFLYNWDGSGEQGSDLYFNINVNGTSYTVTIPRFLNGADTDVYKTVEGLTVGATVDVEGFLYWYNGPQMHVTNVVVK